MTTVVGGVLSRNLLIYCLRKKRKFGRKNRMIAWMKDDEQFEMEIDS